MLLDLPECNNKGHGMILFVFYYYYYYYFAASSEIVNKITVF